jgi:transposase
MFRFEMPEDLLPEDHRARLVWRVVCGLDLSAFTASAKAVVGRQGRPVKSVRMLLSLWLYAISVGVGSARKIARLTASDEAFRWIVGDQQVSHSSLSTFRVGHGAALEKLFTDVLGVLLQKGLLSLDLVAQDGTRVRASASAPSFRREGSLKECREQAALHLKAVLAEQNDPEASAAEQRARLAAARRLETRVEDAIARVTALQQMGIEEPRASTTDADAHVMKMGDGGYRPAYNVQMATAGSPLGGPRTIVGILVSNVGTDMGSVTPMLEQIERRTGKLPKALLADAGHAKHACIESAMRSGVDVLIPVPKAQQSSTKATSDEVVTWRERMKTDEAKALYRARAGLCELPNANLKTHQGVNQVLVRSLEKITCVALLAGLAANVMHNLAGLLA